MSGASALNEDAVLACADLVGRAGASKFEIGYLHDDVPIDEAGWYATAFYRGTRLTAEDHASPSLAAQALAERLLADAGCRCGERVVLTDGRPGCRWRLMGQRWEPGCTAPPIHVDGERGNHAALAEAWSANRAQRRAARRKGR